jgi:hypothetical protein
MGDLAGLAEDAIEFLRENNVKTPSVRFKELWAIEDEHVTDCFNCLIDVFERSRVLEFGPAQTAA